MKRLAGPVGTVAVLLLCSAAARAAVIACGEVEAPQGGQATVQISLEAEGDEEVAGTQNDLTYDPAAFQIQDADCVINPAIGPDSALGKELQTNSALMDPARVRNLVLAFDNSLPIPSGALYTCTFTVRPEAAVGEHTLVNDNAIASSPTGERYPTTTGNCTIIVREAPTPTPTPRCRNDEDCPSGEVCVDGNCVTPTPTPIGFCNSDQDCPEGQVCVNHMCVTPTPTRTPIGYCTSDDDCPAGQVCVNNHCVTPTPTPTPIGYCTSDEDCPSGQVCIDNMCVAVTPTRKKSSGGGGCSCEVDPGAPVGRGDLLAVLLPALLLALRWRRRA